MLLLPECRPAGAAHPQQLKLPDTLPRTFAVLWLLNRACEIQLASMSMGPVIEIAEDVQQKCTRDSLQFDPQFGAGQDVFDALTRVVDRMDPSYRT